MDQTPLFENLADQSVPERRRGQPRFQVPQRNLIELRVVDLDGLVAADDPVRDVWAYVETLDLKELCERIEARESLPRAKAGGEPGRPPIEPKLLMALWLYATLRGVGAAREVERLCAREIGFQWLCGGVSVNYHTLSDFRVDNGDLLNRLLSWSVAVLVKEGLVNLDRLSLDGLRVRAAAGAASFRRGESLKKCLEQSLPRRRPGASALVEALAREVADDPAAPDRRQRAARERAAADRVARIEAAQKRLEELQAERARRERGRSLLRPGTNREQTKKQKEPRASTTDPEARVMKMPDGGFRPAYNGQLRAKTSSPAIAEPTSGVILGVAVDISGSDHGWIKPMVEQVRERFGRTPKELLVDGGFSSVDDVEWAAQPDNGAIAVFMAATKSKHGGDPYARAGATVRQSWPGASAWRAQPARRPTRSARSTNASTPICARAGCIS
jgi:transposase